MGDRIAGSFSITVDWSATTHDGIDGHETTVTITAPNERKYEGSTDWDGPPIGRMDAAFRPHAVSWLVLRAIEDDIRRQLNGKVRADG